MNYKIVMLICYYGQFPWYFPYFLHTCSYNPSIIFVIITDVYTSYDRPNNVKVLKMSMAEVAILASRKLGFSINLKLPYKLCDLRPSFGIVFSELLEGYDFWGYCDIDIVFGNIRNFVTEDILYKNDIFSPRHDYLMGAFSLFKNVDKVNRLFMHSRDYERVFSNEEHYCFDETNFQHAEFTEGIHFSKINSEIESMTHVVIKQQEKKQINAYFDFHVMEGLPGRIKWQSGKLVYNNQYELMLFHLIQLKKISNPKNAPRKISDTFYISPTRIYT